MGSNRKQYHPSGKGGTCSPPATPAKSKMADGVWKGVYPQVFGHSKQLLLNKFFDPSTPSMRKVRDGGEKKTGKKEKTDDYSGHYVIASNRLPERRPLERLPARANIAIFTSTSIFLLWLG